VNLIIAIFFDFGYFWFQYIFFSSDLICCTMRNRSVGLVLGGGGSRGLAHLGILKAFQDNDIPVDFIGGTSQVQ
jgi:hypothetical protein